MLAFPCNQFGGQEPGTPDQIKAFAAQYKATFPLFAKVKVNGGQAHPLWKYLRNKLKGSFGNFIKWNYTKFLIAADGTPIKRYGPKAAPLSFEEDIKALLEVTGPCDSSVTECFPEETAATPTDWQTEYESVLKKLEKAHGVAAAAEEERNLLRMQLDLVTAERDRLVSQMPKVEPHPGWTNRNKATAPPAGLLLGRGGGAKGSSGPPWEAAK